MSNDAHACESQPDHDGVSIRGEPGHEYLDRPGPSLERKAKLFALLYSSHEVDRRFRRIHEAMLDQSPQIRAADFTVIGTDDLERLFAHYDREFFQGRLGEMLIEDGSHPAAFRLSRRLTSAAGQTLRRVRRVNQAGRSAIRVDYEITVSTTLLYNTFAGHERTVTVGGLVCSDRLEALQRIFEHELLHLAEFLGWGSSNCKASNFRALSRRLFAHEAPHHDLITPREQAKAAYDIQLGDTVSFEVEGVRRRGVVNRITRRATVLVEDHRGRLYSNGKHCIPYYVPLALLHKEDGAS